MLQWVCQVSGFSLSHVCVLQHQGSQLRHMNQVFSQRNETTTNRIAHQYSSFSSGTCCSEFARSAALLSQRVIKATETCQAKFGQINNTVDVVVVLLLVLVLAMCWDIVDDVTIFQVLQICTGISCCICRGFQVVLAIKVSVVILDPFFHKLSQFWCQNFVEWYTDYQPSFLLLTDRHLFIRSWCNCKI